MDRTKVNGLPLPPFLLALMKRGRWLHPGDVVLKKFIPFLPGPLDFLSTHDQMCRESSGTLASGNWSNLFQIARCAIDATAADLPWLDADCAVFIAVNRVAGDDLGIALDYRTGMEHPRVVASDWQTDCSRCSWREVSESFEEFARGMRLDSLLVGD